MSNNKFTSNSGLYGGAIYCNSCKFIFLNNSFSNNVAKYGGDIYLDYPVYEILLDGMISSGALSYYDGGSIYIYDDSGTAMTMKITKDSG